MIEDGTSDGAAADHHYARMCLHQTLPKQAASISGGRAVR
jgi:hypothetical protein